MQNVERQRSGREMEELEHPYIPWEAGSRSARISQDQKLSNQHMRKLRADFLKRRATKLHWPMDASESVRSHHWQEKGRGQLVEDYGGPSVFAVPRQPSR